MSRCRPSSSSLCRPLLCCLLLCHPSLCHLLSVTVMHCASCIVHQHAIVDIDIDIIVSCAIHCCATLPIAITMSCAIRHCATLPVAIIVMLWHWPSVSWCCCCCCDTVAMAICVASLLLCRCVVRACCPSWVIVVMLCTVGHRGSLVSVQVQRMQERLTSRLPPLASLMWHQQCKWWWDRRCRWWWALQRRRWQGRHRGHCWGCWG